MKTWFRNMTALSLLFAYSLSLSISVQNYLIDSVLKTEKNHHVSTKTSEFKTPEINLFPNLEPLGDVVNSLASYDDVSGINFNHSLSKHVERYTLTKDNHYLNKSKNIQPGLDMETLLYPFHTFS
ncbi:hypothetical protein OS188_06910 [Xanthomarina sp. F1114]|uniref:hypothetical protein n=1 Tax=Xanthomarina sp. F1114 TaxID=2996019 RepID=UPI00225E156B|nr:hypothetical protein [Xanthomarina sp. F1114]MCX7547677.1 hypothetical protein [Xanthomarina sp. F1114]